MSETFQPLTDSEIKQADAVDFGAVASKRGIAFDRRGKYCGPCPHCGGTDRFSITIAKKKFLCRHCHPKGGGGAIRLAMFLDEVGFRAAVETLISKRHAPVQRASKPHVIDDRDHRRFALELWRQAVPPNATLVEAYLRRRGLSAPSADVIRFHARCPFGKDGNGRTVYTTAMLALVRNIVTDEPQAIHRTALDRDGNKAEIVGEGGKRRDRMALGPIQGGAIKLTDDAEVTKALGIGEGIETTLSLQRVPEWFGSPVWSLLSKDGVRDFPALPGIETLMVAVDHDAKHDGERAATAAAARWRKAGCEVLLMWPTSEGDDLNDVIEVAS